jgi:predicted Zn-dependent protease
MVARVGRRIAAATELHSDDVEGVVNGGKVKRQAQWEFHCEDKDEANAFVLPGGKVFVCKGLLKICQTDDELAVVMAHEAAHVQARHTGKTILT